jgi:hypothetical protein
MPASLVASLPVQSKRPVRAPFVPPQVAALSSSAEMIAALYASDFEGSRSSDVVDVARFIAQGVDRLGELGVARDALALLGYWLVCADGARGAHSDAFLRTVDREHRARFDNVRVIRLSGTVQRHFRALNAPGNVLRAPLAVAA